MKAALLGIIAAATMAPAASAQAQARVVTVAAMRDGRVEVDGKPVSDLKASLLQAERGAIIEYYREGADQDPTAAQMDAFVILIETAKTKDMPIRLSPTPDLSSFVDDEGRVAPRQGGS